MPDREPLPGDAVHGKVPFEGRNEDFHHPKWGIFWNQKIGDRRKGNA